MGSHVSEFEFQNGLLQCCLSTNPFCRLSFFGAGTCCPFRFLDLTGWSQLPSQYFNRWTSQHIRSLISHKCPVTCSLPQVFSKTCFVSSLKMLPLVTCCWHLKPLVSTDLGHSSSESLEELRSRSAPSRVNVPCLLGPCCWVKSPMRHLALALRKSYLQLVRFPWGGGLQVNSSYAGTW